MDQQPTDVSGEHKRRAGSGDFDDAGKAIAKRTRSSSGSRRISNADILIAIRSSEERIVREMQTLMDSKISEVCSEFDAKLNSLSATIDDRIQAALDSVGVAAVNGKCDRCCCCDV